MTACDACRWPHEKREHTCAVRTDPAYAQHTTPALEAWLADHANPRFKPRKPKHQAPGWKGRARLTPEQFDKAMRENLRAYGTEAQLRAYHDNQKENAR